MPIRNITPLSTSQLVALGEIAYWWSRAEQVTEYVIADAISFQFIGPRHPITQSIRQFATKRDMLRDLAPIIRPKSLGREVKKIMRELDKIAEDRNYATHGYWIGGQTEGYEKAVRFPILTKPGGSPRLKHLNAKRLREIASEIRCQTEALIECFEEMSPPYERLDISSE